MNSPVPAGDATPPSPPSHPDPPHRPWRTIAAVVGVLILAYGALVGFVADVMSVFAGFPITVNLAILSAAVGGGWLVWVRKSGRIGNLLDREHHSTQSWRDRLIPGTSFVLAVILLSVGIIGSGGREADIPNNPNALPPAAPDQQVPAGDCSEPVTEKLVQMSHHAFASAAFEDSGIDLKPGGYVQQRFIAATAQIASIAVINSRPGTEGPFDPQHIGQLRLSLYRADDQANNIQAIPLKALRSDAAPSADGIVVDAGPNHLQTVFQFCPVPLEPGEGMHSGSPTRPLGSFWRSP